MNAPSNGTLADVATAGNLAADQRPPAEHQEAAHHTAIDVAAALTQGERLGLGQTPVQHLPLFARVAIERLDADSHLRTAPQLDELLQAYANFYCLTVDLETCASAHQICHRRFWNFQADPDLK